MRPALLQAIQTWWNGASPPNRQTNLEWDHVVVMLSALWLLFVRNDDSGTAPTLPSSPQQFVLDPCCATDQYLNAASNCVQDPTHFPVSPSSATALCADGTGTQPKRTMSQLPTTRSVRVRTRRDVRTWTQAQSVEHLDHTMRVGLNTASGPTDRHSPT